MTTPADEDLPQAEVEGAIARSQAWALGFVEALQLCPFARPCREGGRVHRRVLGARGGPPGTPAFAALVRRAAQAARELEALPPDSLEVALLLFPALDAALARGADAARAFGRVPAALAAELGGRSAFYCVAFHPDLPVDLSDEHRAVGLCRRSPDPTLQLVRASALEAARGPQGSTFLPAGPEALARAAAAAPPPEPLSARIARDNLATLRRAGVERIRALLASFGRGRPS